MSKIAVFEPELENDTIILWEAGTGTRVTYPTEKCAETAYNFLLDISRRYHSFVSVWIFAENHTTQEFVTRYKAIIKKVGLMADNTLTRSPAEYW